MKFDKLLDKAVEFANEESVSLDEVSIDFRAALDGRWEDVFDLMPVDADYNSESPFQSDEENPF